MKLRRRRRSRAALWVLATGAILAGAAAAYAVTRARRYGGLNEMRELRALEKRVVRALRRDERARAQAIDIAAVASGVVELSGRVETEADLRHVPLIVDDVPGVHTVINLLEVRALETRLEQNRKRFSGKEGTRWYGGGVGIGRRRQSPATDPLQRDDHVSMISDALQPNREDTLAEVEEAEGNGAQIGISRAGPLRTDVPPRAPEP